jgi:two-component system sensor histidine kinase YesM
MRGNDKQEGLHRMFDKLKSFLPQRLKYRLFAAFVIFILLPFSILNIYNYQKIEFLVQQKISEQSHEQLKNLQRNLEDQMSIAFKTFIFLEQDATVRSILQQPDKHSPFENKDLVEAQFKGINNSFFLYNPSVYFTLLDFHGNVYTSYQPKQRLKYDTIFNNPWFQEVMLQTAPYQWVTHDDNYVFHDISTSPSLLSLYAQLRDINSKSYGLARVSIDYTYWFQSALKNSESDQDYFIISRQGEQVARSVLDAELPPSVIQQITGSSQNGFFNDQATSTLINYSYLESLDWFIINRIPLDILFNEIDSLKQQYFITFILFALAFIFIAFIIAHNITRPLYHLQSKMREAVHKNLKIRLPEHKYRGEILDLTRTFNKMLADTNDLIHRLKEEERNKDAVHFHMLLAQMNPHFLLNTLNTMKWIAQRNHNEDIAEICVSLGKLLETSLNTDIDLIYLKNEIELTNAYLYIQKTRYGNRFEVEYEVQDDLQYAIVPKLSLQPLVENAIQHGIVNMAGVGSIRIRITVAEPDLLCIEVEDNGIGIEQAKLLQHSGKRAGIGLINIKERLRLLFKERGKVEVIPLEQGTLVRLSVPFLLSTPFESNPEMHPGVRRE